MRRLNSLPDNWHTQKILFFVVLLVTAADQLSKLWVRNGLDSGQSWPKEGILRFTHVTNDGIIFGLNVPHILSLIIPIVVVTTALFFYYHYLNRYTLPESRLLKTGFGLIIGGSIGNLIDRFRFGYVTDFIDLRLWDDFHWPAFNLSDSALVIGIILIIYFLLRLKPFQSTNPGKE
jgi:signal peptidase II